MTRHKSRSAWGLAVVLGAVLLGGVGVLGEHYRRGVPPPSLRAWILPSSMSGSGCGRNYITESDYPTGVQVPIQVTYVVRLGVLDVQLDWPIRSFSRGAEILIHLLPPNSKG